LDNLKRQNILGALARWASCPTEARIEHRTLSADELETLANNKLVEIGSHGATHLVLGVQPSEVQHKEINESKQQLESILNRPVTSFSYPYGGPNDVNSHTVDLVKKAGFKLACANIAGVVTSGCDPFWLPRFLVRNWNGREFANRLKKVFNS
jgi:peptidoglycan/xylan/chitin deacetylase (PgdA/CDA1 family)